MTKIKAKLNYTSRSSQLSPVVIYSGETESQNYNEAYQFQDTFILNAREESEMKLDVNGFELVGFSAKNIDFNNEQEVKNQYYKMVESLIKKKTGASDVYVFDHTIRRGRPDSVRVPAHHVHNDYTFDTGVSRASSALGRNIISSFQGRRMIQVNLWRSINGKVLRDPLALLDAKTLDLKDLVKAEIYFKDNGHVGEIFSSKFNDNQKWFYYPEINEDEAVLIKGFDTDTSKAPFALHTAFSLDSDHNNHAPPRESIETRTFVFFD